MYNSFARLECSSSLQVTEPARSRDPVGGSSAWREVPLAGRALADRPGVRSLIRRMSLENPLWGAAKIHGELLKLGIEVAQSTVSTYMVPRRI